MSLVLNMVGGGGGSLKDTDAILIVTVPTGSTVTMTKGGVTLTPTMWVQAADPTLDCALFVIAPSMFDAVNAWTVTATDGTSTASDTVIISTNKQYSVEISFYYLFRGDGVYTGEWNAKNWWQESSTKVTPSLTINTNLIFGITNSGSVKVGTVLNSSSLPLSKDTIFYTWNSCSLGGTSVIRPAVLTPYADSYTIVTLGNAITTNTGTDSIDISTLASGNCYFGFRIYTANGSASASFSEVGLI